VKEMLDPAGVLNRGKLCFGDGPREAAPGEQGGKPGEVG
jgi:hypothetical protein